MKSMFDRWIVKVVIPENKDECWVWVGSTYRRGYGHIRRKVDNKWIMYKAHRFSYEYYNNVNSESIKDVCVLHTCDNPWCVNPKHLFLGTNLENMMDKVSKGRQKYGNNQNHNLLSKEIADSIRKYKSDFPKMKLKDIATIHKTSPAQVCRILKFQIWE